MDIERKLKGHGKETEKTWEGHGQEMERTSKGKGNWKEMEGNGRGMERNWQENGKKGRNGNGIDVARNEQKLERTSKGNEKEIERTMEKKWKGNGQERESLCLAVRGSLLIQFAKGSLVRKPP